MVHEGMVDGEARPASTEEPPVEPLDLALQYVGAYRSAAYGGTGYRLPPPHFDMALGQMMLLP